jgi:hypothetical protein
MHGNMRIFKKTIYNLYKASEIISAVIKTNFILFNMRDFLLVDINVHHVLA